MTTIEIAAGGAALVGLWALLFIASWLEDLVFPDQHHRDAAWPVPTQSGSWHLPAATPALATEATIAAPIAVEAA